MRTILGALVAALVATTMLAGASTLEGLTGKTYQFDGGSHGDASDACGTTTQSNFAKSNLVVGQTYSGLLAPPDDAVDYFGFTGTGGVVMVSLLWAPDVADTVLADARLSGVALRLRVWEPACDAYATGSGAGLNVEVVCRLSCSPSVSISPDAAWVPTVSGATYWIEVATLPETAPLVKSPIVVKPLASAGPEAPPTVQHCNPACSLGSGLGGYRLSVS